MVKKIYDFQPGDLVTALFYDKNLNRVNWRLGIAVNLGKFHRHDLVAKRRWRVYWGHKPAYSMVDFGILNAWSLASNANDKLGPFEIQKKHGSCFVSTVQACIAGQVSNPMRDDMLAPDLRMCMYDAVSGLSEPRGNAQVEIDRILESHFSNIEIGV